MVRAILEGRKTMTRRVARLPYITGGDVFGEGWDFDGDDCAYEDIGVLMHYISDPKFSHTSPYGKVGDQLWVRETWAAHKYYDGRPPIKIPDAVNVEYAAGGDRNAGTGISRGERGRWRPSIHMPKAFSRITLGITEIRMQRLQEIDEADAIFEGVQGLEKMLAGGTDTHDPDSGWESAMISNPVFTFRCLWEKINGKREGCYWDANPWVWVVEFRRVEK